MEKNVLEVQMSPKLEAALVEMSRTIAESRRETDRALAESRAETEKSHRELDAKLEKMAAEADKRSREADERIAELRASVKELKESVHELGEFYGGVSKNIGFHAEEFFQNALEKTLTFGGIKFDKIDPNLGKTGSRNCEFDIGLKNGTSVALIEVKNRVRTEFVEELATKKLARFRKFYPDYAKYKVYLGLAGFSFEKDVKAEAKKYGIGVIRQDGDTVQVDAGGLKVY